MITCQVCAKDNTLGTIYCRQCGTKLIIDMAAIERSVAGSIKADKASALLRSGRSAMALCSFALVCAGVFRYVVVPPMPPTVFPPTPIAQLFLLGTHINDEKMVTTANNKPQALPGRFSTWRRLQSTALIPALTIDAARLRWWHDQLLASVEINGMVNQGEPLAATALTALAIQAWPHDTNTINIISRMQTWLRSQTDGLVRKDPLTAALVTCALADWEVLSPTIYAHMEIALLDGQVAPWQLWLLPLHTTDQRPREFAALRKAADHQLWQGILKLIDPEKTAAIPIADIPLASLTTGELRMAWTFCAWSTAHDPERMANTLATWSQQEPAPVEATLKAKCGPLSSSAVNVLTFAAPWRIPGTWLAPAQAKR
jgi:hypothetical protein